jgi:large subunit ribosomal protein L6
MKIKNYTEKIEIPTGVTLKLTGSTISLKGPLGEVTKVFKMPAIDFSSEGNSVVLKIEKFGVYQREQLNTIKAHVKNMIHGCQNGNNYLLKICSSHFPITAAVSGNKFVVKNLYGEKVARELIIKSGAKVVVKAEIIEVTGPDKDIVSQVAADIEMLTRIVDRDRRIFQDGIYIISKNGVRI